MGGSDRMDLFPHRLLTYWGEHDFFAWVEVPIVLGVTVFLLRRLGLLWLMVVFVFAGFPPELSPDDPDLCVVCGHQSDRDSVDGRDGVLWLLRLPGGPTRFRRRRSR